MEDYHKEMEMLMLRADFWEEEDSIKYRFVKGLRREIKEKVETYPFSSTAELFQLVLKVESHLKTQTSFKGFKSSTYQNWSKPWQKPKEKKPQANPKRNSSKRMTDYSSTKGWKTRPKASCASSVSEIDTMPMPVRMQEHLLY